MTRDSLSFGIVFTAIFAALALFISFPVAGQHPPAAPPPGRCTLEAGPPIYTRDLATGRDTVRIEIERAYANAPHAVTIALADGASVEGNIAANCATLRSRGLDLLVIEAVDLEGRYGFTSPTLSGLAHYYTRDGKPVKDPKGKTVPFNYDKQYKPGDVGGMLESSIVAEGRLRRRYCPLGDWLPMVVREARKAGLGLVVSLESLGRLCANADARAEGERLPAASPRAENLPAPSETEMDQVLTELRAAIGTIELSVGHFPPPLAARIEATATRLGFLLEARDGSPAGASRWGASVEMGTPTSPAEAALYAALGDTDTHPAAAALVFGRARARNKPCMLLPGTRVPWPDDPRLGAEAVFVPERTPPVDPDDPRDRSGMPVMNRSGALQRNRCLYALIAEGVVRFRLASDSEPGRRYLGQIDYAHDLDAVLEEFAPASTARRPVVNLILDRPTPAGRDSDGEVIPDFGGAFDRLVRESVAPAIVASIQAAGCDLLVSEERPIEGPSVRAYWLVTTGGGETIVKDQSTRGPPWWCAADDLSDELLHLCVKPGVPVIVSTLAGLPNHGNWLRFRQYFGIPEGPSGRPGGLAFRNRAAFADAPPNAGLMVASDYQTSLVTTLRTSPKGEILRNADRRLLFSEILPEFVSVAGERTRFRGWDLAEFGACVNIVGLTEIPRERILLAGPDEANAVSVRHLDDHGDPAFTETRPCVYALKNAPDGCKIWLNPSIVHPEMAYAYSAWLRSIAGLGGPTLRRPCTADVSVGPTTVALAYADTMLDLDLPIPGDRVRVNRFSCRGARIETNRVVRKKDCFPLRLGRHELVILDAP